MCRPLRNIRSIRVRHSWQEAGSISKNPLEVSGPNEGFLGEIGSRWRRVVETQFRKVLAAGWSYENVEYILAHICCGDVSVGLGQVSGDCILSWL